MELLDHGLAVSADLIAHGVDVNGIQGVKVRLNAAAVLLFLGLLIRFGFLCLVVTGTWYRGWQGRLRCSLKKRKRVL
jgi:hypothetical protein